MYVAENVHVHNIVTSSLYTHTYMHIFIHMPRMLSAAFLRYGVSLLILF